MGTENQGVVVRALRVLSGPNIYAYMPVLHAVVDIGPYDESPSCDFPGFTERLLAWLPGLYNHGCRAGRPGGLVERLRRGTYLPHICEHVCLELQGLMGFDVSFGRVRGTGEDGVYNIVVSSPEAEPGMAAFTTALRLVLTAMHDEPLDVAAEIERLRALADEYRLGPSTAAIVRAARRRGIPVIRLKSRGSLVQLGYGVHQKRICASETALTSAIAVDICQEKPLTNAMLRTVGVPVPDGRTVKSDDEAWQAALAIGGAVVVKPADGNQGKGVSVELTTEAQVREGYAIARKVSEEVLVERYVEGRDYRLLVINGQLVAAALRAPAAVVGDGRGTIAQLVERLNQDPRRRPGHSSTLSQVQVDEAVKLALVQQGVELGSVPAPGQVIRLRQNSNLSTGGTATDVTDEVHPSNARLAELAAQILALDVAGIDMLCHDISRPLAEQGGAIVEVNAAPGLRMHLFPTQGQPRDVGRPIVDMLYPGKSPSRIPIIAVTGTNGKTTVTRLIAHIFSTARRVVGMTCTDGTYIKDKMIIKGDCSGPQSARAVLLHPHVEVAVLETARGGILREGLAFDMCTIGVVTNISADHLGLGGVNTLEELARVKQVIVEAVSRDGAAVLNADDPLVAEMAAATDAAVVYFSAEEANPVVVAHLAEGGRCALLQGDSIVLATGEQRTELVELDRIPFTLGGRINFQVLNALAATAAAWAAGLNPAMIVRALSTFTTDTSAVPGRLNVWQTGGTEVVVDYGHNAAALRALGQACDSFGTRRTVLVLTLPGDRRDEEIAAAVCATTPWAQCYVLYDDPRGRPPLQLCELIRQHVPPGAPIEVAPNRQSAIVRGWELTPAGGRLVVIADDDVSATIDEAQTLTMPLGEDASCQPLADEPNLSYYPQVAGPLQLEIGRGGC